MKLTRRIKVKNSSGLHARPATMIVRLLQNCRSKVFFTYRGETVNAKSIMSLLMLAAGKNAQIDVTIEGEDGEEILDGLEEILDEREEEK